MKDFTTVTGGDAVTWTYLPQATATVSIPPRQGVRVGWSLFWRSLGLWLRREGSVDFEFGHYERMPYTIERDET